LVSWGFSSFGAGLLVCQVVLCGGFLIMILAAHGFLYGLSSVFPSMVSDTLLGFSC